MVSPWLVALPAVHSSCASAYTTAAEMLARWGARNELGDVRAVPYWGLCVAHRPHQTPHVVGVERRSKRCLSLWAARRGAVSAISRRRALGVDAGKGILYIK